MNALHYQNEEIDLHQYASGKIPFWDPQNRQIDNSNAIAAKALHELTQLRKQLYKETHPMHKAAILESCDLADIALRVLCCIVNYFQHQCKNHLHPVVLSDKEQLQKIQKDIDRMLSRAAFIANSKELHRDFVLAQLKTLPRNLSAIEALIGENGLLSPSIFTRIFGIATQELLRRCLTNAVCQNLKTVEDLIRLVSHAPKEISNSIVILKNHLDRSRERALTLMDPSLQQQFNTQWDGPIERDRISQGKMLSTCLRHTSEKMEAWDFIHQGLLQKELETLSESEKPLAHIRFYKGEKGGFYLKIFHCFCSDLGKKFLGEENFSKLQPFDNHFWSPNGTHYYSMCSVAREGCSQVYWISFETEEDNPDATIEMNVNNAYASLYHKEKFLGDFERESITTIKALCCYFATNQAVIIPFITTRSPKYLFQMQDGRYIYITSTKSDMSDSHVYIEQRSSYVKQSINEISHFEGTLFIHLADGGCIYSPASWQHSQRAYFDDAQGSRHELKELPVQEMDYQNIGIDSTSPNLRPTMWDLYQPQG